jgi:DNA-binding winged helix-turn-helix (wHTH) protein
MKLVFGLLTLDLERLCLLGPAGEIKLRPKSFEVLRYLAERAGQTITKDELIAAIWPNVTVTEESLTRCISDVRLAIGDQAQRVIKTLPKRGYLLEGPVSHDGKAGSPSPRPSGDFPSIALWPSPTSRAIQIRIISAKASPKTSSPSSRGFPNCS